MVSYDIEDSYDEYLDEHMWEEMDELLKSKAVFTIIAKRCYAEGLVSSMGDNMRKKLGEEKREKEKKDGKIRELKRRYQLAKKRGQKQTKPYE